VIETIRQGLEEDGFKVLISKLCQWFNMPRRTVYYKSVKATPKVRACFAEPTKAMINEQPSFGYRTVTALLGFNKNKVQRIFQQRGWQVKKRPIGFRPRVQALPSVARGAIRRANEHPIYLRVPVIVHQEHRALVDNLHAVLAFADVLYRVTR
jgi:putative transposase